MVSTRKKRQSNRRLLSQLDDFNQDMIIGNAASERQENTVVNEGTNDRDFTVGVSNDSSIVNGKVMNVKNLERCFNEKIDREMNKIADRVEDKIQNAILIAIDNIVAPKIELAIRSINASSGRDVTSVSANSERREQVGINAPFESASRSNDTLGVSKANDQTRHNIADEVSELSVPEAHFDRQPHTRHTHGLERNKLGAIRLQNTIPPFIITPAKHPLLSFSLELLMKINICFHRSQFGSQFSCRFPYASLLRKLLKPHEPPNIG